MLPKSEALAMGGSPSTSASPACVGLIAGWGSFPVEVARQLREDGKQTAIVALKGHADPQLEQLATHYAPLGILKIGSHMRFLSSAGAQTVVMAGKLFKDKILYEGRGWIDHAPDFTCARILGGSFLSKTRDARDDTILTAVTNAYERRGMKVLSINQVAPGLLARDGVLTKRKPSRAQLKDIRFGWQIARQMGGLDVGQSITVKDQVVLAVEAIESTDGLIARTAKLCPRGGFTLIKVAKPDQDMRFDVPTIGARTVEQMVRAGGTTIAIEAHKTILVDRHPTLELADRHQLCIVSLNETPAENALSPARQSA